MKALLTHDVVVLGGGPAGSVTAKRLAAAGVRVALVGAVSRPGWEGLSVRSHALLEEEDLGRHACIGGPFTRRGVWAGRAVEGIEWLVERSRLAEALRYVQRLGIERIAAYEHELLEYATPRLADIPGVRLVGTAEEKASVLSFVLAGHEPLEVGKALNAEGIAVRAGHHCAQPALRRLGLEATVRPSFSFYNTHEEIDVFLNAVRRIAEGGTNVG